MNRDAQTFIQPITEAQRGLVIKATADCLTRAEAVYQRAFPAIPIRFDLRGRAAGMYRLYRGSRLIRYNPHIFAKYFDDGLAQTVPHEVAHYVTDLLYGLRKVRPHGPEWRHVAMALGASPRATGHYDLSGIPLRQSSLYDYRCACTQHRLGVRRHTRVQRGEGGYLCRRCRTALVFSGDEGS
jgi:SprT protein